MCGVPAAGHVLFLTDNWETLCCREVCAGHLDLCRRLGGCMTFPLDRLPPDHVLLPALNAEIIRRRMRPPQPMYPRPGVYTTTTASPFTFMANGSNTWVRF